LQIVIAHRLSTVRDADLIMVLHEGELIEAGSHHELLARNGGYAALVAAQLGPETEQSGGPCLGVGQQPMAAEVAAATGEGR